MAHALTYERSGPRLSQPRPPVWKSAKSKPVQLFWRTLACRVKDGVDKFSGDHLVKQFVGADDYPLMAVLKADAYGHGAVQVAHTVLRHGAVALAVACLSEGQVLRAASLDAEVLVLGYTPAA
jgi:hypothetical protein